MDKTSTIISMTKEKSVSLRTDKYESFNLNQKQRGKEKKKF